MKFYDIQGNTLQNNALSGEYQSGRAIGAMRIGKAHIYFKSRMKTYVVALDSLERIYRRVVLVPARMCCGTGDLAVEYIVLEQDGKQVAQIQMPGERAGKAALEELKKAAPNASFVCPPKEEQA